MRPCTGHRWGKPEKTEKIIFKNAIRILWIKELVIWQALF